ncbi:hypothetical protein BGW80DRAFT_423642 [Lactifluus volemus]|nr:hypothetical protein BGW80DRAFT_423642 [Lactifluus volemus]
MKYKVQYTSYTGAAAPPSFFAITKQTDQVRRRDARKRYRGVFARLPTPKTKIIIFDCLAPFSFFLFLLVLFQQRTQKTPKISFSTCVVLSRILVGVGARFLALSLFDHVGFFGMLCWNFRSYKRDCICY